MNAYLQKQQAMIEMALRAGMITGRQQTIDMLVLSLNDPKVMANDPFGEKRILRVTDGIKGNMGIWEKAWTNDPEADYMRAKLDAALKQAMPGQIIVEFKDRYEYVKDIKYKRWK